MHSKLHGKAETPAQEFAAILESDYGLMLDPVRHQHLCGQIEAFVKKQMPSSDDPQPDRNPKKRGEAE